MKILHIIQRPQLRGAEMFASQIGTVHHRNGHEVCFVAIFNTSSGVELKLDGPDLVKINAREGARVADIEGWRKLGNFIKKYNPDIVQANASDTLKYSVFSKLLTRWKAPLVYRNANKAGDFIKSPLQKMYNKWLVSHVDFVASVSENCMTDFMEVFSFPKGKIASLPIGTPIVDTPIKTDIRTELGIAPESDLIVNIGSFVREKNHLGLIDIFRDVCKENENCHLLLIGDGKLRSEIEEKIKTSGIADRIHLTGYRNDAVSILKQCTIMLMPSYIEGLPGVILEAMAHHVPVVASDIGGIGEVIKNNDTGYLGNPHDASTFSMPVIRLLTDKQLRGRITDSAYKYCVGHLDIEVIASRFMSMYENVTKRS